MQFPHRGKQIIQNRKQPDGNTCASSCTTTLGGNLDCDGARFSGARSGDGAGANYPAFNAFIYSAGVLLPIIDLEMQSNWIPDENRGWLGEKARWYLWLQIAMGWALSLLAVAGFAGLVKSD
ncbi:MAG: hypothetical protein V3V13_03190 [Paracoccaceae bacterium]